MLSKGVRTEFGWSRRAKLVLNSKFNDPKFRRLYVEWLAMARWTGITHGQVFDGTFKFIPRKRSKGVTRWEAVCARPETYRGLCIEQHEAVATKILNAFIRWMELLNRTQRRALLASVRNWFRRVNKKVSHAVAQAGRLSKAGAFKMIKIPGVVRRALKEFSKQEQKKLAASAATVIEIESVVKQAVKELSKGEQKKFFAAADQFLSQLGTEIVPPALESPAALAASSIPKEALSIEQIVTRWLKRVRPRTRRTPGALLPVLRLEVEIMWSETNVFGARWEELERNQNRMRVGFTNDFTARAIWLNNGKKAGLFEGPSTRPGRTENYELGECLMN
jgi:hypothetical protein